VAVAVSEKNAKVFNMQGSVRFSVRPGHDKKSLTVSELASLSDYFQQSGIIAALNGLAAFSDDNGILIPEMVIKVGKTELIVNTSTAIAVTKTIPWYKKPVSSWFRRS
jgi:hypothetical protein